MTVSKVVCIPDMSALQNLGGITIGGRDIREWLIRDLEILMTPRALKELDDGRRSLEMEDTLFNKLKGFAHDVKVDGTLRDALNELTGKRLSRFQDGELSSVVLALRFIKSEASAVKHAILLSDDLIAFERSLGGRHLLETMPAFCFWNSADFVLYLAFRRSGEKVGMRIDDYVNAMEAAIEHICKPVLTAPGSSVRQKTLNFWRQRKSDYIARLKRVYEGSKVNW